MTQVSQTSAAACDAETYAVEAAEADFVLAVQSEIQKLMHEKNLRARDLSKRLNVTEARVSQMFGEQAKNLTLRTIAKIFHHLGETPHITTIEAFERALTHARGELAADSDRWTSNGFVSDLQMATVATNSGGPDTRFEPAMPRNLLGDWIRAEKADAGKPRRLVAVR